MADAMVTVGADLSEVSRAARTVVEEWRGASNTIGSALSGVTRSLTEVALAAGKVNFFAQHEQVKQFEAATAKMAIATGRSLESVRSEAEKIGQSIGKRPQEVVAWASEVGKLTYNFQGAMDAQRGFSELAAMTGRSVDDYKGLAAEMGQLGMSAGDASKFVGTLAAQANLLGTSGGVAQFADQVEALGDVLSRVRKEDLSSTTAMAGALGKGLSPQAAMRVQQQLNTFAANPVGWSRFFGKDILDEHGMVKNPAGLLHEYATRTKERFGKRATWFASLPGNLGPELGHAVMGLSEKDWKAVEQAAKASPIEAPKDALNKLVSTDAGQRARAESELAASARNLMGSSTALGRAADALQQFAAGHPVASTVAATAAGGVISSLAGRGLGLLRGIAGGAGGAASAAGAAGSAGGGFAGLGSLFGVTGYGGTSVGLFSAGGAGLGTSVGAAGLGTVAGLAALAGAAGAGLGYGADKLVGLSGRSLSDRLAGVGGMSERTERGFQASENYGVSTSDMADALTRALDTMAGKGTSGALGKDLRQALQGLQLRLVGPEGKAMTVVTDASSSPEAGGQ